MFTNNTLKTYGTIDSTPKLYLNGKLNINKEIQKEAKVFSKQLKFDEYQAILIKPLKEIWRNEIWEYQTAKYSYITTLRKHGFAVEVITANLLVIAIIDNEEYFLLQKRSSNSGLYPGFYSIFGGAFSPKDDNNDLYKTAVRELFEEIEGITDDPKEIYAQLQTLPKLLTQETDNGNLQINFLGVRVHANSHFKGAEDEGDVILVKVSEIENFIKQNKQNITPLALACLDKFVE